MTERTKVDACEVAKRWVYLNVWLKWIGVMLNMDNEKRNKPLVPSLEGRILKIDEYYGQKYGYNDVKFVSS